MALRFYNTLSRQKDEFVAYDPHNLRIYVCGPTVYDFAHIGNARPVIVFDILFRLLRYQYGEDHVTYVRNITDVDDKINARALKEYPHLLLNEAIARVTETTTAQFQQDCARLGCLEPTLQPRATENIAQMIEIIRQLIEKSHAYEAAGEVLFDVKSMPDYGELSHRNLEQQQAGARVAVEAHKRNAADFVLWKLSTSEEPGWDSPWGRGRPGWHIECSAMSKRYLGEVFDIHGGGLDLIFPHHENEIAQTRCAFGHKLMARYWLHNGFVQVEGQKMSKSLGNFITINDVLNQWHGLVARLNMLRTHYRQPLDWTERNLEDSAKLLHQFQKAYDASLVRKNYRLPEDFLSAVQDDMNLHEALMRVQQRATHILKNEDAHKKAQQELVDCLDFLGFAGLETAQTQRGTSRTARDNSDIEKLLDLRKNARTEKNWAESDRLRKLLDEKGVTIQDNKDGTTSWELK